MISTKKTEPKDLKDLCNTSLLKSVTSSVPSSSGGGNSFCSVVLVFGFASRSSRPSITIAPLRVACSPSS